MAQTSYELVSIYLEGPTASIHRADGAVVQLSRDVIQRSSLLRNVILEAENEDQVFTSIPEGVLDAWLGGLEALSILSKSSTEAESSTRRSASRQSASWILERKIPRNELLIYIQAADFLIDQASLANLCAHAAYRLFAPYIDDGELSVHSELSLGLIELPRPLRLSVLAAAKVPLYMQLRMLPESLQGAALHATFPSIAATDSLTVPDLCCASDTAGKFWDLVGRETSLTSLECCMRFSRKPKAHESLLSSLRNLSQLQSLNISSVCCDGLCLTQVVSSLSCQSTLEHLDLSGNVLQKNCDDVSVLADCLAEFTSLRSLDISSIVKTSAALQALGSCIAQLPCLQSLTMRDCDLDDMKSMEEWAFISRCHALRTFKCDKFRGRKGHNCILLSCPLIEHLEFPKNIDLDVCVPHIAKLTSLRVLRLHGGYLSGGLQSLADHITLLQSLQDLCLPEVHFGSSSDVDVLVSLLSPLTGLTELSFPRHSVTEWHRRGGGSLRELSDAAAVSYAPCLAKMPFMRHLSLSLSHLGQRGAEAIGRSLWAMPELESLNLCDTPFVAEGAKTLVAPLVHLPCLQSLSLDSCLGHDYLLQDAQPTSTTQALYSLTMVIKGFERGDFAALAAQGCNFACLRTLRLQGGGVMKHHCDVGSALALFLQCLTQLKCLDLSDTSFREEDFAAFAPFIGHLTTLTCLDLAQCGLQWSLVNFMSTQLTKLVRLHHLKLRGNCLGSEAFHELARCVRVLPVLSVVDVTNCTVSSAHVRNNPHLCSVLLRQLR